MRRTFMLRSLDFGAHFEYFLVSAVASILAIRIFLHLTGYPTVGGESLHVAHMLWGGLFMAVALLLLLGWLGRSVRILAAVLGGIGFGTFIDELGKFITHDNDYFYEPTFALIYVVFILMWIATRSARRRPLSDREALANAMDLALEATRGDLETGERERALGLLERAGESADPIARAVREALRTRQPDRPGSPHPLVRLKARLHTLYLRLVNEPWFAPSVVGFFAVLIVANLAKTLLVSPGGEWQLVLAVGLALLVVPAVVVFWRGSTDDPVLQAEVWGLLSAALLVGGFSAWGDLGFRSLYAWGELIFSLVPGVLVVIGILRMGVDRRSAYRWFKRAVLVLILVTQFFAFYLHQLSAVYGLFGNLLVLITLNYMIAEEERRQTTEAAGAHLRASTGTADP